MISGSSIVKDRFSTLRLKQYQSSVSKNKGSKEVWSTYAKCAS